MKYLTIVLREVNEEDDQKTDGETVYKHILLSAKLKTGQKGQGTALTGRSPLRR